MKNYEEYEFVISVWKKVDSRPSISKNIRGFIRLIYNLTKVLFHVIKKNQLISVNLFAYSRYSGATSWGILEPVINKLKGVKICIISNDELDLSDYNMFRIKEFDVMSYASVGNVFKNIVASTLIMFRICRVNNRRINSWIVNEYFMGLMAYSGMKSLGTSGTGLIVETDATGIARGLVYALKVVNGTSFCLQHGTMADHQFPSIVDHYYLWGEYFKKEFIRLQGSSDMPELHVSGYPRLEQMNLKRSVSVGENFDVMVLSSTHGLAQQSYISEFMASIATLLENKIDVIVKLHPAENPNVYREHLTNYQYSSLKFITNEFRVSELAGRSKCVFLIDSAAVLELLICGTPLLFLNNRVCQYPDQGCGVWVDSKSIVDKFKMITIEKNYHQVVKEQDKYFEYLVSNFGKGTIRVSKDIKMKIQNDTY